MILVAIIILIVVIVWCAERKQAPYPEVLDEENVRRLLIAELGLSTKETASDQALVGSLRLTVPSVEDAISRVASGFRVDPDIRVNSKMTLTEVVEAICAEAQ